MTKRELTDLGKSLVKSDAPQAFNLYKRAWTEYPDEFNNWDAFFLIQSLRNIGGNELDLENQILEKFADDDRVSGMYVWVLFDRHVKHFDDSRISEFEPGIVRLTEITKQKDLANPSDGFPCPYTISVFKLLKAYKKPNFNIEKISFWTEKLDEAKLSRTPNRYFDEKKQKDVEMASDFESYLSIKAKLLERTENFDECIAVCEKALAEIKNMHHDNNIWFTRLKALSFISSGRSDEGEQLLESLLKEKKGQKWFIKKELAEVFNDHGEYDKALSYAIDAAMTGEDYPLKTELFLLIARVYYRIGKNVEAGNHARLLLAITQQEDRRVKADHQNIYNHFQISPETKLNVNEWLQACKMNWEEHQFGSRLKETGTIETVHSNGKSGFIKSSDNARRFFSMREFINRKRSDESIIGYEVSYFLNEVINNKGENDLHAVHIEITNRSQNIGASVKVGQTYSGIIDGIADFGLFIKFDGAKGLLHRKNLPVQHGEDLRSRYNKGDSIEVKVKAITPKGVQLVLN